MARPSPPGTPLLSPPLPPPPPPPHLWPPPVPYSSSSVSASWLIVEIALVTIGVSLLIGGILYFYFKKRPPGRDKFEFFPTFHHTHPPSEPYSPSWQVNPLLFVIYLHTPPPSLQVNNNEGSGSDSEPKPSSSPENLPPSVVAGGPFKYEDLKLATNGFAQSNLLGHGEFGFVYRGVLRGKDVVIKKLPMKPGGGQGDKEFRAEAEIISRVQHRNLCSLIGYCKDHRRLLVYEYVPNKTLDFHLHGSGRPTLDWLRRWKIALGSAKGLAYLHEHCDPKIIHRNIKATNILLDYNFEPKVADYGFVMFGVTDESHFYYARQIRSFDYVAPEYARTGKLTDKSDVYSYGVMLLELITGRKPIMDSDPHMDQGLVNWARPLLRRARKGDTFDELIDPWLETNYDQHDMTRLIHCASAAVRESARKRPRMGQIERYLEGEISLEDLNAGIIPGDIRDGAAMNQQNGAKQ
ncbi:proline-rich receptor-like protein kinase PERK1 [Carex rostrata]